MAKLQVLKGINDRKKGMQIEQSPSLNPFIYNNDLDSDQNTDQNSNRKARVITQPHSMKGQNLQEKDEVSEKSDVVDSIDKLTNALFEPEPNENINNIPPQ